MDSRENAVGATRRAWNWRLWAGFLVALVAPVSYFVIFFRYPITRNVPWVNWLLFLLAGWFLWEGLRRALQNPATYRGKIFGPILTVLSLGVAAAFGFLTLHATKNLPHSTSAPRTGASAPEFVLADSSGKMVALSTLLSEPIRGSAGSGPKPRGVLLIFYRGYW